MHPLWMQRLLFIQRLVSTWRWTSGFKKAEVWHQGIGTTVENHSLHLASEDTDINLEFQCIVTSSKFLCIFPWHYSLCVNLYLFIYRSLSFLPKKATNLIVWIWFLSTLSDLIWTWSHWWATYFQIRLH